VTIPFEEMGTKAVDAVERIVMKGEPKGAITSGPYLFMDAALVDGNNVRRFL
jgi:simple sugar transport system substrate-binding protein/ribose transport system substrate-binding protein